MILQSEFPPDIRVEKEMKALTSERLNVFLLSNKKKDLPDQEEFSYGIVIRLKDVPFLGTAFNRKKNFPVPLNPFWLVSFVRVVFQKKIEVIHVHDLPFALLGIIGKVFFHKKFVLDLHENYPAALALWGKKGNIVSQIFRNPELAEIYEKWSLRFADAVIVVAPEHKAYLQKKYDILPPIEVVGNTVEWGTYDRFPLDENIVQKYEKQFVLSFLGQFSPERDLDVAVKAVRFLKQEISNLKLIFVGDGVYRAQLQKWIEIEGVNDHVEIIGWVPFEETSSYLAVSDICIIPQGSNDLIDSGTPHKLFQYMAMGKPVLVSDARAMKNVVEETRCGEVFRSRSAQDFAQAVLKIRNNADFPYGENGVRAVQIKYNWQNSANVLRSLYKKIFS